MLCFYIDPPARFAGITEPAKKILQMDLSSSLDFSKRLYAIGYKCDEGNSPYVLVPSNDKGESWWWSNGLDGNKTVENSISVFSSLSDATDFMYEKNIHVSDISRLVVLNVELKDTDVVLSENTEYLFNKEVEYNES